MNGQTCGPEGMALGSRGSCAIGVMAKSPRPGHSKTRLCPPLRPEQAAQLSAAFLTGHHREHCRGCAVRSNRRLCRLCSVRHGGSPRPASGAGNPLRSGGRLRTSPPGRGRVWSLPPSCNPAIVRGGPRRCLRAELRYPDTPNRHPDHCGHGPPRRRRAARGAGSLRRWGLLPPRDAPPPCPAVRRYRLEQQLRRRNHAHPGSRAWSRSRGIATLVRYRRRGRVGTTDTRERGPRRALDAPCRPGAWARYSSPIPLRGMRGRRYFWLLARTRRRAARAWRRAVCCSICSGEHGRSPYPARATCWLDC